MMVEKVNVARHRHQIPEARSSISQRHTASSPHHPSPITPESQPIPINPSPIPPHDISTLIPPPPLPTLMMLMMLMMPMLLLPPPIPPLTPSTIPPLTPPTIPTLLLLLMLLPFLELILRKTSHDGPANRAQDAVAHLVPTETAGSPAGEGAAEPALAVGADGFARGVVLLGLGLVVLAGGRVSGGGL